MQADPRFESLCAAFFERHGLAGLSQEDVHSGFSFRSGDLTARVTPLPDNALEILIELAGAPHSSLSPINFDDPAAFAPGLLLVARLNYLGRGQHAWTIAIDDAQSLVLMHHLDLGGLDVDTLEEEISEGLERAARLLDLWQQVQQAPAAAAQDPLLSAAMRGSPMIKA